MADALQTGTFEQRYLSGAQLYGDDFTPEQIAEWFEDEREGYSNLGSASGDGSGYGYHQLNIHHGFRHLPEGRRFRHALGVGSAFGAEFEPIVDRLDAVTVLDPSDQMVSTTIGGKLPTSYVKPAPTGILPFPDATFDLVVCLGTLHHISNVSTVLAEMGRVVEPGGYALIREPIVSMGDWRRPRRDSPSVSGASHWPCFGEMVTAAGFTIEGSRYCCFPATSRLGKALRRPRYFNSAFLTAMITRPAS